MKYSSVLFFFIIWLRVGYTQDSSSNKSNVTTRFYIDAYYSYDFNRPLTHEKAPFIYNYKKHNRINANLALASVSYKGKITRANIGLMTGTYATYNLSSEPGLLKHLFEANAGVKISKNRNLWLDAGVMPSHIGFESAISKDCWTPTRSILAENTPYYENGIRLSQTSKNEKVYTAVFLLNGWQRSRILQSNLIPSLGTQITYKPTSVLSINWGTFLGNIKPDSISQWRYLNNFYAIYQVTNKFGITLGLDHGVEQKQHRSTDLNIWYSPILITRFQTKQWAFAARVEYYQDKSGTVVPLINDQFFQMKGYSLNIDRKIGKNNLWRLEWRYLNNTSPYFLTSSGLVSGNHSITTSFVFEFIK
jgi:hypothetical protein